MSSSFFFFFFLKIKAHQPLFFATPAIVFVILKPCCVTNGGSGGMASRKVDGAFKKQTRLRLQKAKTTSKEEEEWDTAVISEEEPSWGEFEVKGAKLKPCQSQTSS